MKVKIIYFTQAGAIKSKIVEVITETDLNQAIDALAADPQEPLSQVILTTAVIEESL